MLPSAFSLTANEIGLALANRPPDGFDPTHATAAEIQRFGLMPAPGRDAPPSYNDFWNATVTPDAAYVTPSFAPRPVPSRAPLPPSRAGAQVPNDHWAGIVAERAQSPLVAAYGIWTLPAISVPPSMPGEGRCLNSVWVGLDGYNESENDVLQIGVDFEAWRENGQPKTSYAAWYEWWGGDSHYFDFPVAPGHQISCAVYCEPGATIGTAYMKNITTNRVLLPIQIPAPSGTTMRGNCAEWIVERQTYDGVMTGLCDFGSVVISHAFASATFPPTTPGNMRTLEGGIPIAMVDAGNTLLATPAVLSPTSVRIDRAPPAAA